MSDLSDIAELHEVDLGTANRRISEGWVLLRCFVVANKVDKGIWTEEAVYAIGRPKSAVSDSQTSSSRKP